MIGVKALALARTLWDHHQVGHQVQEADLLFVMCSHDLRVADYAAELFKRGLAPWMAISGGIAHQDDLMAASWQGPEAVAFAQRVVSLGVPSDKVILEDKATNCGENVLFTARVLAARGFVFRSVLALQKPNMERRVLATLQRHWPDKKLMVSSPPISFDDYPNALIPQEHLIHIMVGDLQRIERYPVLGYQTRQEMPDEVRQAFRELVEMGYTKHLMK